MPNNDIFPVSLSVDKHEGYDRNSRPLTGSDNVPKNAILGDTQCISCCRGKVLNGVRRDLSIRPRQGCPAYPRLGEQACRNPICLSNSRFNSTNLAN